MKKYTIAILGFGVVGSGVADLLSKNRKEVENAAKAVINIKYILDLRDFPDSPFSDRVIHDFNTIASDPEVDAIIEVMGGSHPAYEYTVTALKAGKSVITSNKEVVAAFGDEFLRLAEENGVSYRFEAAVGGGIPVISPMISCIRQNKVTEVRGILNGTTNYILTKMFKDGESFEDALTDAQHRGYAESNPAADVMGTDAARKITILTALATGRLPDVAKVHTEGITAIRSADVKAAESVGCGIKLLGRAKIYGDKSSVAVAPFMISNDIPLSGVSDVYNAVEVIAEPLGNVMFYGRGAGAGPTASAVVGDIIMTVREGECRVLPCFTKQAPKEENLFSTESYRRYVAVSEDKRETAEGLFSVEKVIRTDGEYSFIADYINESDHAAALEKLGDGLLSSIRLL